MKTDVWIPLYVGDWLADTTRLTTEQHGAYFLLVLDYWRNGPPPDDDVVLAQITKMRPDAWSNARAVLEHYFTVADGVWRHKRVDLELVKAGQKKTAATSKAKAAATARWARRKYAPSNSTSNAPCTAWSTPQAMLEQCPSPSPGTTTPQPPKGGRSSAVELKGYLANLKTAGEKFLPDDDPIWAYAEKTGLTADMLRLAFLAFKDRYLGLPKRYTDWRAVFRRSVKEGWMGLWYLDAASNSVQLTSKGRLALQQFSDDKVLGVAA